MKRVSVLAPLPHNLQKRKFLVPFNCNRDEVRILQEKDTFGIQVLMSKDIVFALSYA